MTEDLQNQLDGPVTGDVKPSDLNTAHTGLRASQYQEARLDRVLDYQVEVLKKEDNLAAALGTVNAGLMVVTIQMEEFIRRAFAGNPKRIDRVQKLLPCVQTYLQATRQVDRLAQVELRVAAYRKGKSPGNADSPANPR